MVSLTQTSPPPRRPADSSAGRRAPYRLFWRIRASRPWRQEEFDSRAEAYDRFFYLLSKGLEIRWRTLDAPR